METIGFFIGAVAIAVIVVFSVLAARTQEATRQTCVKLDSCQIRELDIAAKKIRGR